MIEALRDRIRRHEGLKLHPYVDTTGNWTIGVGHKIPEVEASNYPDGCTLDDAMNWLDADIQKATEQVTNALPWITGLSELRQGVLVELTFWIGIGGILKFHNTLQAIKDGDYELAAHGLLNSLLHEQIPGRTEELANLLLNDGAS